MIEVIALRGVVAGPVLQLALRASKVSSRRPRVGGVNPGSHTGFRSYFSAGMYFSKVLYFERNHSLLLYSGATI